MDQDFWDNYHTFRLEWMPGEEGYLSWYIGKSCPPRHFMLPRAQMESRLLHLTDYQPIYLLFAVPFRL